MPHCPCCSDRLLRHIKGASIYWFCRSCWQAMPDFEAVAKPKQNPLLHISHYKSASHFITLNQV